MSNQRELDEIGRRLSAFAATLPDHGIAEFGQLVEIETVQTECVYLVTLETEYEERTLLRRETADLEGLVDGLVADTDDQVLTEKEVELWNSRWTVMENGQQKGSFLYRLPGSGQVRQCRQSNGEGAVTCPSCRGRGQVMCPRCHDRFGRKKEAAR